MRWMLVALPVLASPPQVLADPGVTVDVTVTGVRSSAGQVLVAVCDKAAFLQPTCAYRGRAAAKPGSVHVQVAGVSPGAYAVQAFQDENGNGVVDRNFFGMPTEGIGFSRDAKMRMGPPSFDDASLQITGGTSIIVALHYL